MQHQGVGDVVNLSSHRLTKHEVEVLRRGLSFCPDEGIDVFDIVKDVNLFARKLILKVLLDKSSSKPNYLELFKGYTVADFRALKDLILLMQESEELGSLDSSILEQDIETLLARAQHRPSDNLIFPRYKSKSKTFPPPGDQPEY